MLVRYDLLDLRGLKRDLDDMAQYTITHAAGSTLLAVDQDDDTYTYTDPDGWVSLGTYHFNGTGTVQLARGVDGAADVTIAEKVKFKKVGGGTDVTVNAPTVDSPWMQSGPQTLAAGAYLVLVKNYAAFDSRYHVAANNIPVAGVYSGYLSNGGDAIKLFQAGAPETQRLRPLQPHRLRQLRRHGALACRGRRLRPRAEPPRVRPATATTRQAGRPAPCPAGPARRTCRSTRRRRRRRPAWRGRPLPNPNRIVARLGPRPSIRRASSIIT